MASGTVKHLNFTPCPFLAPLLPALPCLSSASAFPHVSAGLQGLVTQSFLIPAEGEFIPKQVNKILPLPLQISYRLLEIGFCYVGEAGLRLAVLLPQHTESKDYRCTPSCLAHAIYIHSRVCACINLKHLNVCVWSNHVSLVCH